MLCKLSQLHNMYMKGNYINLRKTVGWAPSVPSSFISKDASCMKFVKISSLSHEIPEKSATGYEIEPNLS